VGGGRRKNQSKPWAVWDWAVVRINYLLAFVLSGRGFDGLVDAISYEYCVSKKTAAKKAFKIIDIIRSGKLERLDELKFKPELNKIQNKEKKWKQTK